MFKNVFQKIELGIYISVVAGCSVKRQDPPRLSLNWNEKLYKLGAQMRSRIFKFYTLTAEGFTEELNLILEVDQIIVLQV